MKKLYYLILVAILATAFSCMNSRFTNPSKYIKYAGQVNGGGSGGSNSKVEYKTLTINVLGNGSVSVNDKKYTEALKFAKGTKVSRIEADETLGVLEKFQGWSGSIASAKHVIEDIVMDKDITLTASFVIPTVYKKLILTIRKGGGVEIDGVMHRNNAETNISVIEEYEEGKIVSLKAIPNDPNISFGGWSGSLESMNKTITVTLTDTITLSASFSTDKYITINNTPDSYVEINVDNSPITKYTNETIEVKVEVGDGIHITAKANNERTHEFVKWAGSISSTMSNINTIIRGDLSLILEFKQVMKTLTIKQLQGQAMVYRVNGTTYTGPRNFPIDTEVNVELVEKYYPFISWSGDASGSSKAVSVKLDVDRTLNTTFETGVFDVYDDPTLNGYNASQFDTWVIAVTDFGNEEIPAYMFYNKYTWGASSLEKNGIGNITQYKHRGDNSKAAGFPLTNMNYLMYKGENYYMNRDKGNDDPYNSGLHANRLKRFYFYRFTGKPTLGSLDNALCVVDTYTKLLYAYAVPTDFTPLLGQAVPTKWEGIEVKDEYEYKFYEYDPIGYVDDKGSVVLFESFKIIQRDGSALKYTNTGTLFRPVWVIDKVAKMKKYLPKIPSTGTATIDFTKLNEAGGNRSPYLVE